MILSLTGFSSRLACNTGTPNFKFRPVHLVIGCHRTSIGPRARHVVAVIIIAGILDTGATHGCIGNSDFRLQLPPSSAPSLVAVSFKLPFPDTS